MPLSPMKRAQFEVDMAGQDVKQLVPGNNGVLILVYSSQNLFIQQGITHGFTSTSL